MLLELEEQYKRNNFGIDHETFDYREYISKPIFKHTNTAQLFHVLLGEKTTQQLGISKSDFDNLFESSAYKNGLVITNLLTLDFIGIYETIESKSKKIIELIEIELAHRKK